MPRSLTQYRVFIGSPGGLQEERKRFRELLERYSKVHGEPAGVVFHPVGWEDTLGGVGRPQEIINRDLEPCDFAVFVFHDRWGTPTGNGRTSGTEEELELAEKLYAETKLRNIVVLFKNVNDSQLRDPGPQLQKVLNFKKRIEGERKYLHHQYSEPGEFHDLLEAHLARWLREHGVAGNREVAVPERVSDPPALKSGGLSFDYWIAEAKRLLDEEPSDAASAAFCARNARASAHSKGDWAKATNMLGKALSDPADGYRLFDEMIETFRHPSSPEERRWLARAMVNKGVALGRLNRSQEEIAAYDDVIARFGNDKALNEETADALFNKGAALHDLSKHREAIGVYDDLIARFGSSTEEALRDAVAEAFVSKGAALRSLQRFVEEIAAYDSVVSRVGAATELRLRKKVASALVNKSAALTGLGRTDEAIAIADMVDVSFGTAASLYLKTMVALALCNKAQALITANQKRQAVSVLENLISRFDGTGYAELKGALDIAREKLASLKT